MIAALVGCSTPPPPAPVVLPPPPTPVAEPEPPPVPVFPRNEVMADYIDRVKRKIRNKVLTCAEEKAAAAAANAKTKRKAKPFVASKVCFPDNSAQRETLFQISLQPNMTISGVKMIRSSGDPRYDAAATAAIKRAASYPPLPEGLDFAAFATHKIKYRLHDNP